jgi:hypothetical protein
MSLVVVIGVVEVGVVAREEGRLLASEKRSCV